MSSEFDAFILDGIERMRERVGIREEKKENFAPSAGHPLPNRAQRSEEFD
jgi:hypothetical protein